MFELTTYRCPECGAEIREKLSDGQPFNCFDCRRSFRVLLDPSSDKAGFAPLDAVAIRELLNLPRGSVRAVATLVAAGCCPRFDPAPWDSQEVTFENRLFVKDRVRSFLHIPLNCGKNCVVLLAQI